MDIFSVPFYLGLYYTYDDVLCFLINPGIFCDRVAINFSFQVVVLATGL